MTVRFGLCPRCLELKQLTRHHIYPKRWFKKDHEQPICYLCRDCHNDIEYILWCREKGKKLKKHVYLNILISFLTGK